MRITDIVSRRTPNGELEEKYDVFIDGRDDGLEQIIFKGVPQSGIHTFPLGRKITIEMKLKGEDEANE
jgi:hypothetical protein